MSHRAIERLRREREGEISSAVLDEKDDFDESDEDEIEPMKKANVFAAAMFDDDSSDDSIDDSTVDSDAESSPLEQNENYSATKDSCNDHEKGKTPDVEDLDTLLEAYKLQDAEQEQNITATDGELAPMQYDIITSSMEARDLDIEHARRSLFGAAEFGGDASASSSRRHHRQINLFGTPSESWQRPPHYIGGGIGFKAYADCKESSSLTLPWPYCDIKEGDSRCPPLQNWLKFVHSDSYERDYRDMKIIQDSGDPNAMLLFIVHHPYVVEALLQISIVMYQMNQSNEGLSFLKRALWIFECAAPKSFLKVKDRCALMDYQEDGNSCFFSTLFRLVRVSYIGGLTRTSLATSQFLLSLDPLRDPKNVLLSIDHFALMCNTEACNTWLVDFVESEKVRSKYLRERSVRYPFYW